jgi:hypothetical protein
MLKGLWAISSMQAARNWSGVVKYPISSEAVYYGLRSFLNGR